MKRQFNAILSAVLGIAVIVVTLTGCDSELPVMASESETPDEIAKLTIPAKENALSRGIGSCDICKDKDSRARGKIVARLTGSMVGIPHTWPIILNIDALDFDATLDKDGLAGGALDPYVATVDFGDGPNTYNSREEVVCMSYVRSDHGTNIWLSTFSTAYPWAPEGNYIILHILDSPEGDRLTGRSMHPVDGDPSEFCKQHPDLSASDPWGTGPVELLAGDGDFKLSEHPGRVR
ncbi:MAG: hypothetical protein R3224_08120 [Balneolaceae bacterium]|nr:hypothetical protein [Balneolaceae bacterium]